MSSRVRLLFYSNYVLGAHIGSKALQALEKCYLDNTAGSKGKRVGWRDADMSNYSDAKSKELTRNVVRMDGVGEPVYRLQIPIYANVEPPPPIPPGLIGLERVKWLWEHLPKPIRDGSRLEIIRESRSRGWHKQSANPWLHGVGKQRKKRQPAPTARFTPATYGNFIDGARQRIRDRVNRGELAAPQTAPEEAPRVRIGIWA